MYCYPTIFIKITRLARSIMQARLSWRPREHRTVSPGCLGGGEVARMSGRQKSEDLQKLGEGKAHTRYEIGGLNQVNEISEEWRDIG